MKMPDFNEKLAREKAACRNVVAQYAIRDTRYRVDLC